MKNYSLQKHLIRLGAALALAVSAVHAQAQNVLVTFDLTQLQNNATSSTITGSDGITTLTVSTIDNWGGNTGAIFVDGTNGLMTGLDSTTSGLLGLSFNRDVNFRASTSILLSPTLVIIMHIFLYRTGICNKHHN